MARVYLDLNIYRQLEGETFWRQMRQSLDAAGHRVIAGDALIGETIKLEDPAARVRQFRCISGLRHEWTPGVPGEEMITEAYRTLRRQHPDWIQGNRAARLIKQLATNRRKVFTNIASNQAQQDLWSRNLGSQLKAQAESIREWQRATVSAIKRSSYRSVLEANLPAGVVLPASLSDAELQWRLLAAERFYAMSNGLSSEPVNYFVDICRGISVRDWARFWLEEVSLTDTPATAIHGLVRYHQLFTSLKGTGNMIDAMHATEALGCDYFVTSDENLARIMGKVRADMSGLSPEPRWIPSGKVTVATMAAALS
jgi:hypothetical protein